MAVHPTAIVSSKARLAADAEVGPYAVVGDGVEIGAGSVLHSHAVVIGPTTIGKGNRIHSHAVLGGDPQDLKYKGERTSLEIGDGNVFREGVTVNRGTRFGGGVTRIGHGNLIMATAHVAHDCQIGDGNVFANAVLLAGHVRVESHVHLMGVVAVHPFAAIGQFSFVGGYTPVSQDVPPYMMVNGIPPRVRGVNSIGLGRHGYSPERIQVIKEAYRKLYRAGVPREEAVAALEQDHGDDPDIRVLLDFLKRTDEGKHGLSGEALRKKKA